MSLTRPVCFLYFQQFKEITLPVEKLRSYTITIVSAHVLGQHVGESGLLPLLQEIRNIGSQMFMLRTFMLRRQREITTYSRRNK